MADDERRAEIEAVVTRAVRHADKAFVREGGSSRHWVRDHFLPALEAEGLTIDRVHDARGDDDEIAVALDAYWQVRSETQNNVLAMGAALEAADRVRDARGDDDLRDWLLRTVGVASSVPSAKRAIERLVADAIAESRVRDARGDDEAVPEAARMAAAKALVDLGYGLPAAIITELLRAARPYLARSPQGEDHEA